MHLGVVAQGLEVADALDGAFDGLPVEHAPGVQLDAGVEALEHEAFEDLRLDAAHELDADLPRLGDPDDVQLRVLLIELHELRQQQHGVRPLLQAQAVAHHRLEHGALRIRRRAETLSGPRRAKAQGSADPARAHLLRGLELCAGVNAQGADFLLQRLPRGVLIAQEAAHLQAPARDLEPGQAAALRVAGYLVDARGKPVFVYRPRRVSFKRVQKLRHPVGFESRAEEAGEELSPGNEVTDRLVRDRPGLEKALHGLLIAEGDALKELCLRRAEIHAALREPRRELLHQRLPARAGQIHLGNKEEGRHPVALQELPQRLGMGLDPVGPADDQHRTVEHAEGALGLCGEVDVARRVEQAEKAVSQWHDGLLGEDGDAALPLETVGVKKAVAVVDSAEGFQFSGEKEHRLGQGGLSRVHMGEDAQDGVVCIIHAGILPFFA